MRRCGSTGDRQGSLWPSDGYAYDEHLGNQCWLIDGSGINVALTAIGRGLKEPPGRLTLVLSAHLLTISSLLLLCGALARPT